ncbi:class II aldolase/adducin family protein [Caviibacter abscessus]|uniref:class II aldolase/adducin family protein n=1 Tax=Caviibacter abscessus TaxID=1766719 RepID=UPI0008337DA6|nr:class II aldolase/adducin family protein [Caviibacter abscessus]
MDLKELIVEAGKNLYNRGLVAGTSGNISIRNLKKKDSFFITPSGIPYNKMTPSDVVEINSNGEPYINGLKPSSEWKMHIAVYKKYSKYNAIVHTHSTFATALSVVYQNVPLILVEMKPYLGGDIKVSPFKPAGSAELGETVLPYLENRNSCILGNHGTISCGSDIDEAFLAAEYVEDAAKIYYYAKTLGDPRILDL